MARQKLPMTILIEMIEDKRGVKLSNKHKKKIKEHLNNNSIHNSLLQRKDYHTLSTILVNYVKMWVNTENNT